MASTTIVRFLSLLVLLLPSALREYLPNTASNLRPNNEDELHPIVLVPGGSCSELEARLTGAYRPSVPRCGAMKGKGWFGLWQNVTDLPVHDYVPCFMEQASLVYDPVANDYRNIPGVETRVPNFGTTAGFHFNPAEPEWCLESLRHRLERMGYRDGDTLFGAPYDLRMVPPAPGQPSQAYSRYFRQLTALIENASNKGRRHNKKVILFGHSFGGTVALDFVRAMPMAWRDKYIKHIVVVAPLPAGGLMEPVKNFISGNSYLYIPTTTVLSLRPLWRTFETAIVGFPSTAVFGDRPLVITKRRNYSAHDMADLIADVGAGDVVEPFRRRQLPRSLYFEAPMVPVTCINGVGRQTPEQLVYWESDFDSEPDEIVYGDGDQCINSISMLAFDEEMSREPRQRKQFKSVKLHGATHGTIVTEEWSLKRVVQEITEANKQDSEIDVLSKRF